MGRYREKLRAQASLPLPLTVRATPDPNPTPTPTPTPTPSLTFPLTLAQRDQIADLASSNARILAELKALKQQASTIRIRARVRV